MSQFYSIFIVLPPGLETLGLEEIKEKSQLLGLDLDLSTFKLMEGGIECSLELEELLGLSLYIKLPTRILLRLGDGFKARDLPKLYKKTGQLPFLKDFLTAVPQEIKCTSERSRLINTSKIKKAVQESLENYFRAYPPKKKIFEKSILGKQPVLHIRMIEDQCQISLDISGGNLFKRGERKLIGVAPLRENIAAALFFYLKTHSPKITGILDPMCGSGSILIESQGFYSPNSFENLSFSSFPIYLKGLGQMKDKFLNPEPLRSMELLLKGHDHKPEVVQMAIENFGGDITLEDFWSLKDSPDGIDSILVNPPWDKRIKLKDENESFEYSKIINVIKELKRIKHLVLLLPKDKIQVFSENPPVEVLNFRTSGLKLSFLRWEFN